jgi:DNA-binding NarL/FixJ family response regulator
LGARSQSLGGYLKPSLWRSQLCPEGEEVDSEVRTIRQVTPDSPILVFGPNADPELAKEALRAGANGFIYAGMGLERIARVISLASESEVVVPRELLGELVGLRLFLKMPKILGTFSEVTPRRENAKVAKYPAP